MSKIEEKYAPQWLKVQRLSSVWTCSPELKPNFVFGTEGSGSNRGSGLNCGNANWTKTAKDWTSSLSLSALRLQDCKKTGYGGPALSVKTGLLYPSNDPSKCT